MRIKQVIMNNNLSKMKNQILPTCLQVNYRNSLGEFSNTSCGMIGAESVNCHSKQHSQMTSLAQQKQKKPRMFNIHH